MHLERDHFDPPVLARFDDQLDQQQKLVDR